LLPLTAYKQGSPESAIIFFKRACDIDPNLADAQYNLGMIFQSEKRVKEAAPRYLEVLRVKPTDPDAHYQLALCYIDMQQAADAKTQLQTIAPNNPHFADAQKRLTMIDSGVIPQTAAPQVNPVVPDAAAQNGLRPTDQSVPGADTAVAQPLQQAPQQVQPQAQVAPQAAPQVAPQAAPLIAQQPVEQPVKQAQPAAQAAKTGNYTPPPAVQAAPPVQVQGPVPAIPNAEVKVVANHFNAPAGVAFDKSGNLYVANFGSNLIERIAVDGTREKFSAGANIKGPIGLVVDLAGNVYVANYTSGTIARISPSGVSTVIASGFKKPYYLSFDKVGNLFVSQQEDNSVVRISFPKAAPAAAKPL
jgi:hypothetical protein